MISGKGNRIVRGRIVHEGCIALVRDMDSLDGIVSLRGDVLVKGNLHIHLSERFNLFPVADKCNVKEAGQSLDLVPVLSEHIVGGAGEFGILGGAAGNLTDRQRRTCRQAGIRGKGGGNGIIPAMEDQLTFQISVYCLRNVGLFRGSLRLRLCFR